MFCYESNLLMAFCNWVAIVVQGYINFVVPALLYRAALLRSPDSELEGGDPDSKQLLLNSDEPLPPPDIEPLAGPAGRRAQGPVNALPRTVRIFGRTFRSGLPLPLRSHFELCVPAIPPPSYSTLSL